MPKVLVVDDAAFMRMILRNILVGEGFDVIEAINGKDGVEKYMEGRPDAVTMDITMPEMNGIEATRAIMALDPKANIVMCSAMGQEALVFEAITAGAKNFIVKPFQREQVLEAVKSR